MKKVFFFLCFAVVTTHVLAQTASYNTVSNIKTKSSSTDNNDSDAPKSKIGIGFRAGYNIANVSTDFAIVSDGEKAVNGFNAGVFMDVNLGKNFSLQPQLLYNGKGLHFDVTGHSHTIHMNSIDLPIYLNYKLPMGFFVGVAPNFGYYFSGKNTTTFPTKEETVNYEFTSNPFDYKRFDFGASAMVGYEHKSGISLSINYLKGLNKVANLPDNTWSSNVLAFSLGYKL